MDCLDALLASIVQFLRLTVVYSSLIAVDGDLNDRLDEVSEYYKDKGVCEGKDCHRLLLQVSILLALFPENLGLKK